MASLEQRNGKFRIIFRYRGQKYTRSLKTQNQRAAAATLARVEDNLSRLELGHLTLPDGAAVSTFVLSDGRLEQRPGATKLLKTLEQLLDEFLASLTPGVLEPTTEHCIRIHVGHFKRVFGSKKPLRTLGLTTLQQYVDIRAKAEGLRGTRLSATTIKKEIATLNMIWSWAKNHELIDRPLSKQGLRYPKMAACQMIYDRSDTTATTPAKMMS
jgi:hypothetical protein